MSVLPAGWAYFSLNDVGGVRGGKTPSKSNMSFWADGSVAWASPKDMKDFILSCTEDLISRQALNGASMSLLPKGSVLFVTRSGILEHTFPVSITSIETTINQDLKAVIPNDFVKSQFLAYALKAFGNQVLAECSKAGTTVASVETEKLEKFQLPLPPLAEQKRIADKLDALLARVDAVRARLDRVPALLKRFRQSVLAAATSGQLTEADVDDWQATDMQSIAEIGTGSTPLRSNKSFYANDGTPWVMDRPAFCRHLGAIIHGNDRGVYGQQAIHR